MRYGTRTNDLTRTLLAVLALGGLLAATFWVMKAFLTPMIWAAMIVIATWPVLLGLQARLGGKRSLAVAAMTLFLVLALAVPIVLAVSTLVGEAGQVYDWIKTPAHLIIPGPPAWVANIPLAGHALVKRWTALAALGPAGLAAWVEPYAKDALMWLAAQGGNLGLLLVKIGLSIVICALFYGYGETAANGVLRFTRRLAGEAGESAAVLAAKAVKAVALGVGLTALVQAGLAGIGLALCGVPAAVVLTAVAFVCCIAQIGPTVVMLPAVLWLYFGAHDALWGTVLLVWSLPVVTIDNFLRPVLIRKGVDLPFVLILAGVIGGLLGFGVIGLFIGPVVLAVAYTLVGAWMEAGEEEPG